MAISRRTVIMIVLQSGVWGMLAAGIVLSAEEIEHHGSMVDSEGSYRDCLTCHDGVVATGISPCLADICMLKDSHPVDKPYPPPDKMRAFAPAAVAEASGIKFLNGRIDCISCHDLRKTGRFHLRVEDTNSRLCLACHLK